MPFFGFSQKDTIAHLYTFGSLANDLGEDISATSDGGFIVVGSTASSGDGNTDVYLLKIDSLCNKEWSWALGGLNNDWGYAVRQTYDNGYIIAATSNSFGNGGYDAMLIKRDSFGNYEWQKTYGGNDWDFAYDVVQTFDSGYVFCGETYNNTNGYSDVYVVKTNSIGDTVWTRTVGGTLIDKGNALIQTSDSNIVVAGLKNTLSDSTQAYVLKFDKNGDLLWDSVYGGIGYEKLTDVIELQSGKYAFTGTSNSYSVSNDLDHYYLKVDTSGILLSFSTLPSGLNTNDEESNTLLQLQDGRILMTGYTKTFGYSKKDVHINALDENGNWAGIGVTFGYLEDEEIYSSVLTNNQRIVLVGTSNSYGFGNNDLFLIRLDTIYHTNYFNQTAYLQNEDVAPIGLNDVMGSNSYVSLFPNPATQLLNIITVNFPIQCKIYDYLGRNVFTTTITHSKIKLDISFLSSGLHLIELTNGFDINHKEKLIIAR